MEGKANEKRSRAETRGLLRRFMAYYKPYKKLFCMDMGASLLVSLVGVVYPIITRTMLNDLIPNRNYRLIVILGLTLLGYGLYSFLKPDTGWTEIIVKDPKEIPSAGDITATWAPPRFVM